MSERVEHHSKTFSSTVLDRSLDPSQRHSIDEPILGGGRGGSTPPTQGYPAITKSDQRHGWTLPGLGSARDDCGQFRHKGCLNSPKHPGGKIFVKAYRKSCMKASCPICWSSWSTRESHRISHRMRSFKPPKYRAPIHVIFSPPQGVYNGIKELRKTMYRISKIVGLYGGLSVFHPYRHGRGEWGWGPHFHTLGYGWIVGPEGIKAINASTGWIVKNKGVRKDVGRVANYLLSHAGIRKGQHTVTWFGALGYAKLKVQPEQDEENCCPYCKATLVLLQWIATDRPPPIPDDYEGLMDCDGWEIKISEWQLGRSGLDVDSAREVMMKECQIV